ncbi:MAG: hypothetical protein AAF497_09520 [Planctomycetota bacterium]
MPRWISVLAILLLASLEGQAAEWEFSDGGRLQGSFVRVDELQVVVKRGNRVSLLPFSALSDRSRSIGVALALKDRPREWSNGEKTVKARYAGFKDGKVQLKIGGKKVSAYFSRLIEDDKAFVRSQLAAVNQLSKLPENERQGKLLRPEDFGLDIPDWYITRNQQIRTWTSNRGQRMSGRMLGSDGDHVCIASAASRTYVAANELSFEDQDYVRHQLSDARRELIQQREAKARQLAEKRDAERRRIANLEARERQAREAQERANRLAQQQRDERTSIYPSYSNQDRDADLPSLSHDVSRRMSEATRDLKSKIPRRPAVTPPPPKKVTPLQTIAVIAFYVGAIGSFVCSIILSLKILNHNPIIGIAFLILAIVTLSIFSVALFFIGWANAEKRNLESLMSAWTMCLLLAVGSFLLLWAVR